MKIYVKQILTEQGWQQDYIISIEDECFTQIRPKQPEDEISTMMQVEVMLPALVDSHVHGGAGVDVMDGTLESLTQLSQHLASQGVGAFLATTVTDQLPHIERALINVAEAMAQGVPGATILGSYLEGPYFTERHKGAHDASLFRELDTQELDHLIAVSRDTLKAVALAPEKKNACHAIRHLKQRGVNVMLAHTNASYAQANSAFEAGADGIVHCYNGMSGLHHREPGVVGAGLSDSRAYIELIADGHHVHPAAMKICVSCAAERLVLISDAMRATGQPDGEYFLGGNAVRMQSGIVTTQEGGLAGSTLALFQGVKNLSTMAGVELKHAIESASLFPARLLGVEDKYGSIAVGKKANFLFVNPAFELKETWVNGNKVWCCESKMTE